jgi:hypothetical protein
VKLGLSELNPSVQGTRIGVGGRTLFRLELIRNL